MKMEIKYLLRIDRALWRQVRSRAAQIGKPVSVVIRDLLANWLESKKT